jgi:hypothetical protein
MGVILQHYAGSFAAWSIDSAPPWNAARSKNRIVLERNAVLHLDQSGGRARSSNTASTCMGRSEGHQQAGRFGHRVAQAPDTVRRSLP